MHETSLIAFVAVTSVAVVLQTLILAGMYFSTRKMGRRMEALSSRVEEQVLPLVEKVRGMVDESAPKIQTVITNLAETSDAGTDASWPDRRSGHGDRRHRPGPGERADVLATRTMQRVDLTAEKLQHTVNAPVRHLSALMEGVTAGFSALMSGRKAQSNKAASSDEMFI